MKKISTLVTLSWLRGFFESDGCFTSPQRLFKPEARFSQKSNGNLLEQIQEFLKCHTINSTYSYSTNSNRAPILRIQGKNQVKSFIDLLKSDNQQYTFIGKTQRQFLIFDKLCSTPASEIQSLKDLLRYNSTKREGNIDPDTIQPNDPHCVKEIKNAYNKHKELMEKLIAKDAVALLTPEYLSGLLDGDGSYIVRWSFKETYAKRKTPILEWEAGLVYTTDKESILTLNAVKALVKADIMTSIVGKKKNGIQIYIRSKESLQYLFDSHSKFPLLGTYSCSRFDFVVKYYSLKESGKLQNKDEVIKFMTEIRSLPKTKGKNFALTLEESIARVNSNIYRLV